MATQTDTQASVSRAPRSRAAPGNALGTWLEPARGLSQVTESQVRRPEGSVVREDVPLSSQARVPPGTRATFVPPSPFLTHLILILKWSDDNETGLSSLGKDTGDRLLAK